MLLKEFGKLLTKAILLHNNLNLILINSQLTKLDNFKDMSILNSNKTLKEKQFQNNLLNLLKDKNLRPVEMLLHFSVKVMMIAFDISIYFFFITK
jgi:hypothetical protein